MRLNLPTLVMAGLVSSLLALPAVAQTGTPGQQQPVQQPGQQQQYQQQQYQQQQYQQPSQAQSWQTNRWANVQMTRVEADMLTRYERAAARGLPAGMTCPTQLDGINVSTMDTANGIVLTMTGPERHQDHLRNWARNEGQIFLKQQAMAPTWSNQPVYLQTGATMPGQQLGQATTLQNGCTVSWRTNVGLEGATIQAAADEGCQVIMPVNTNVPPQADIQVRDIDNGVQLTFTARDAAQAAQLRQHLIQNAQALNADRCTHLFTMSGELF